MADNDEKPVVTTTEKAIQAERSPDTFYVLLVSLIAVCVVGAFLLWWYGVFPSFGPEPGPKG
jgi:nitrate reductase NapE component